MTSLPMEDMHSMFALEGMGVCTSLRNYKKNVIPNVSDTEFEYCIEKKLCTCMNLLGMGQDS